VEKRNEHDLGRPMPPPPPNMTGFVQDESKSSSLLEQGEARNLEQNILVSEELSLSLSHSLSLSLFLSLSLTHSLIDHI
jgi:hypothetical protein